MDNKRTGAFISQRRRELGLNQKQLAEKLNLTDKAVSKWETGRSAPDISMLMPLSETLDVSVVEILKGEKIEKDKLPPVSDEVVISTMKKGKKDNRRAAVIGACTMLFTALFCIMSYFGYHYFSSVPIKESAIIEKTSESKLCENFTGTPIIVKTVKKGDYYFYLIRYNEATVLSVFERDRLLTDRLTGWGGTYVKEENKPELYCYGENSLTVNAFFGYGMTDETYSYYYRGVKCTRQIEDEYILDVLIDLDDSFSHASIIYDD